MFRRKTDQVYATLQQVQRRLTDAAQAGEEEIFGGRVKPPPVAPNDALRTVTAQAQAQIQAAGGQIPVMLPTAPPPSPPTSSFHRRNTLQFSGELATVLFLLWVVTLAMAFFIGKYVGGRAAPKEAQAGYAAGDAGSRSAHSSASVEPAGSAAKNAGDFILVLESVSRANGDDENRFTAKTRELNAYANQHPKNLKPWFGVRKPSSGGLQLVFGLVDGAFGVDKDGFASLADTFERAGYKDTHWIRVDNKK